MRSLPDRISLLTLGAALALHARFCWLDERPPADLGHYYEGVRAFVLDGRAPETPYAWVLGGLLKAIGPSAAAIETVDGLWLGVLLAGVWLAARAVSPWAGAGAIVAAASFAQTHVLARTHWIHHPEAAMLCGAVGLATLRGPVAGVGSAILLALGTTTRETGVPFGIVAGALVAVRNRWAALGAVAGALWEAPELRDYVAKKAASAEGYAMSVHAPWSQAGQSLGWPVAAACVPAMLLGLRRNALTLGALAWIAGGAAAVAIFHVGPDNFPLAAMGLAWLVGLGVARVPLLLAPVALAGLLLQGSTLLSSDALRPAEAVLRPWGHAGPLNYLRVWWTPVRPADVLPFVRRACAEPLAAGGRCVILAERGLFNPSWEDDGTFGLFLAGAGDVRVVTPPVLWDERGRTVGGEDKVHAVVQVQCRPGVSPDDGGRFERQNTKFRETLSRTTHALGWVEDPESCRQTWYGAPNGGVRVDDPSPVRADGL